MKTLSIEQGIAIQNDQLKIWKGKLKKEVYKDLVKFAESKNHLAKDGYGICRGSDLTNFIENWKQKEWKVGHDVYFKENGEKYYGVITKIVGNIVYATWGTDEPTPMKKSMLKNATV